MAKIKQSLPLLIALLFGWLALVGLLFSVPVINRLVLGWASLLLAFALLLGALNLLVVHLNRTAKEGNFYSFVLVLSMLTVFGMAITDANGRTDGLLSNYFIWVQAPLEAALASLLAFFLLFAGFRMFKQQRTFSVFLFLLTAVVVLLIDVLLVTPWLPARFTQAVYSVQDIIQNIIVAAGMRGLLIGIALGAILLAIRMLVGLERPYNK